MAGAILGEEKAKCQEVLFEPPAAERIAQWESAAKARDVAPERQLCNGRPLIFILRFMLQ